MKPAAAILLTLCSFACAHAADETTLIDEISARLVTNEVVAGEFVQRLEVAALLRPIESEGRFYFQGAQGIAWYVDRPLASSIFIDEHGMHGSAIDARNQPSGLGWIADLTRSLLLGDLQHLSEMFVLEGEATGDVWSVRMDPKDPLLEKLFEHVDMSGADTVRNIVLHTSSADRVDIRFLNVQAIPELPASVVADMGESAN